MNYNFGTGLQNMITYGGTGAQIGGTYGAIAGAGAGLATGFFGNNANSADSFNIRDLYNQAMFNEAQYLFNLQQQNKYNESNMRLQADLQTRLQNEAFEHNKWFVQNAYQNTVNDLRAAGLNPLLATGNGANTGSVGVGSASALGTSVSSPSGADLSSFMSASASSAQAKVAKSQLGINAINALSDVILKGANASKAAEEAKTQDSIRKLNASAEQLNNFKSVGEEIRNLNLPEQLKSEIEKNYADAYNKMIMAYVADYKKESEVFANITGAKAQEKNAEANYVNATQGNLEKFGIDLFKELIRTFGNDKGDGTPKFADKEYLERLYGRDAVKRKYPEWYK